MHATTKRLFDALVDLAKIDGHKEPGKVAQFLGESAATITNWKNRGISKQGILKANKLLGIDPRWLESGEGEMLPAGSWVEPSNIVTLPPARRIVDTLDELQAVVGQLSPLLQDAGRSVLHKWMDGQVSAAEAAATLEGLLQASAGLVPAVENRAA